MQMRNDPRLIDENDKYVIRRAKGTWFDGIQFIYHKPVHIVQCSKLSFKIDESASMYIY
jgi:hypothetical protein